MTISELGSVGEFLGSIAVFVTLIVLIVQIKQTQKVVAANSYTIASEAIYATFLASATSEFLAGAFAKSRNGEPLSEKEKTALLQYYRSLIRRWELIHYQTSQGLMPEDRLEQFGQRIGSLRAELFRSAWEIDEPTMTGEFLEWASPYLHWNQGDT